jgi:hypothetical protein
MPYLTLQTVDGQPVELSGNNEADLKAGTGAASRVRLSPSPSPCMSVCVLTVGACTAIAKHGKVAAVDAAQALVAVFFQRRKLVIDRQKALQAGKEELADTLDDQIGTLEDRETAARDAYTKAAARGASSNALSATGGTAPAAGAGDAGKGSTGSAYGAAFDKAARAPATVSEDDFI